MKKSENKENYGLSREQEKNLSEGRDVTLKYIIDKDPSAHMQGRKPLRWRKMGERVPVRYMTPKEYAGYTATNADGTSFWDGIERKANRLNWEAWDWGKGKEGENLPPVNRRFILERRMKKRMYKGGNKRGKALGRRSEDIYSLWVHRICLIVFGGTLLLVGIFSFWPTLGGF